MLSATGQQGTPAARGHQWPLRRHKASEEEGQETVLPEHPYAPNAPVPNFSHTAHTGLPTHWRRSIALEGVPPISRASQSSSSLSPRFPPVKYLTLNKAWPTSTGRIRTRSLHTPGSQVKLLPCTFCQPKVQSLDQSHCLYRMPTGKLNLLSASLQSLESRYSIYNGRAERTLPLICRCLHRVSRVHDLRHRSPLDPTLVALAISLTQFSLTTL